MNLKKIGVKHGLNLQNLSSKYIELCMGLGTFFTWEDLYLLSNFIIGFPIVLGNYLSMHKKENLYKIR